MIVSQAAAIPYRRNENHELEILLVTSRRKRRWVFPKGKIKRFVKPHVAAAQEAFEEAGVLGVIDSQAIGVYRQLKLSKEGERDIAIHAFPLFVNAQLQRWPEERLRQRRWMSLDEAAQAVQNSELRRLLQVFAIALDHRDPAA